MFSTIPNVHIHAHALYGPGLLFCFPAYSMSNEYVRLIPNDERVPYLYQQLQSLASKSVTQSLLEYGTIVDHNYPYMLFDYHKENDVEPQLDMDMNMIPIMVVEAYHNTFQLSLERTNSIDLVVEEPLIEIWLHVPEQWDTYHLKEKEQCWMSQIRKAFIEHEVCLQ